MLVLAGCGDGGTTASLTSTTTTTTVSPNVAIASWGKEQLSPSLDAIGKDFKWIGGAVQSLDFADARAGCRDLDTTVNQLEAKLPSPDGALTGQLSDVVDNLRQFSRGCQGLSPRTTEAELDELTTYRKQAETGMGKAVDIITTAQNAAS